MLLSVCLSLSLSLCRFFSFSFCAHQAQPLQCTGKSKSKSKVLTKVLIHNGKKKSQALSFSTQGWWHLLSLGHSHWWQACIVNCHCFFFLLSSFLPFFTFFLTFTLENLNYAIEYFSPCVTFFVSSSSSYSYSYSYYSFFLSFFLSVSLSLSLFEFLLPYSFLATRAKVELLLLLLWPNYKSTIHKWVYLLLPCTPGKVNFKTSLKPIVLSLLFRVFDLSIACCNFVCVNHYSFGIQWQGNQQKNIARETRCNRVKCKFKYWMNHRNNVSTRK